MEEAAEESGKTAKNADLGFWRQIVQGLGNQSDRSNGVNLLPLELVEALSRNRQDQCFSSHNGLWII